jgi:hypothetical protein
MSYGQSKVVDKVEIDPSRISVPDFSTLSPNTTCTRLNDIGDCKDSLVFDSLLTPEECRFLINRVESIGLDFWDPTGSSDHAFRRAFTLEVNHQALADLIWSRVKDSVIATVGIYPEDANRYEIDIEGDWHPVGINPRLLFSRYLDGGHFAPHTDGYTVVDVNERSLFTCVIYLNDCPIGGETRLYDNLQAEQSMTKDEHGRLVGNPDLVLHSVKPVTGRMLAFYHTQVHEGAAASCKYIIRTDVMYRRTKPICTEPEDEEAFRLYLEGQRLSENGDQEAAMQTFRRAFKLSDNIRRLYRM